MIRCRPQGLLARCTQRGYAWDDVQPCIVERHEDGTITVDETHPAYPHKKPGMIEKAANFAAAAIQHVAAGAPRATQEQIDARFAICQQCEHFDGKSCGKCGCPVIRERAFISKLSWADQSCPVGKW